MFCFGMFWLDFEAFLSCKDSMDWPPTLGQLFSTSVLAWSYATESFWRGRSVSMSEIVGYAKSMALTRYREAGSGLI